jgi:acyl-CoA hydrolase
MIAVNLEYENSFSVLPKHCNWQMPMIFGGVFMSELDLCAAAAVSRLLHDTECDSAVTYKASFTFHLPAEMGDLIFMKATIVELRTKAVKVIWWRTESVVHGQARN